MQPTFIVAHPTDVSPLARANDADPDGHRSLRALHRRPRDRQRLFRAERSRGPGGALSRRRSKAKEAGDEEAMYLRRRLHSRARIRPAADGGRGHRHRPARDAADRRRRRSATSSCSRSSSPRPSAGAPGSRSFAGVLPVLPRASTRTAPAGACISPGRRWCIACLVALRGTRNAGGSSARSLCGYGFAWVGHFFFEHNRPATFRPSALQPPRRLGDVPGRADRTHPAVGRPLARIPRLGILTYTPRGYTVMGHVPPQPATRSSRACRTASISGSRA